LSGDDITFLDAQISANPLSATTSDATELSKLRLYKSRLEERVRAHFEGLGFSPASNYQPTTFQPDEG